MSEIAKIDEKGRVVIPRALRQRTELKEGGYVKVTAVNKSIVIEALEPIADKFLGAFRITRWPEDLDEFVVEVMRKWWMTQYT